MYVFVLDLQSLASVQEPQDSNTLHHTGRRVTKELAPRLQSAIDPDVVFGSHEKVAGLGWVVRGLLRDVVAFGAIWVVPVAGEDLTQDWVEGLLDASAMLSVTLFCLCTDSKRIRRFDVPPTQVELGHCHEALDRVVDLGQG